MSDVLPNRRRDKPWGEGDEDDETDSGGDGVRRFADGGDDGGRGAIV